METLAQLIAMILDMFINLMHVSLAGRTISLTEDTENECSVFYLSHEIILHPGVT